MAALDEFSAIDGTPPEQQEARGFGTLGDRPLVVLSHGVPGQLAAWEEDYDASQDYLARLSTKGARVVAKGVGHSIALQHPGLVTAAIEAVVRAVRGGELELRAVNRLAAAGPD